MKRNIVRSVLSVFVGFISVALLSILADVGLEKLGVLPGTTHPEQYISWMLWLALGYRSLFTLVGGYVTATLAPTKPMAHVYALMVLGGIGGVAGAIGGWHYGNHWYPVLLAITGPMFVWFGGKLFHKEK